MTQNMNVKKMKANTHKDLIVQMEVSVIEHC